MIVHGAAIWNHSPMSQNLPTRFQTSAAGRLTSMVISIDVYVGLGVCSGAGAGACAPASPENAARAKAAEMSVFMRRTLPRLAREVHDAVEPAFGRPRNHLVVFSDDLMRFVEIDEERLECPRHRAVRLERASRLAVHGEVLAARVSGQCRCVALERANELDGIAMRPVERTGHSLVLLFEHELQPEMLLDRHRPVAGDG